MQETITDVKIDHLKPVMRTLPSFKALELTEDTAVMVKADGEFTFLSYSENGSYTQNRWGKARTDFPALNDFVEVMQKSSVVKQAEILCELYVRQDGKPLKLPDYIHHMKGGDPELLKKIHIGVFDLLSINGHPVQDNYVWKLEEVKGWLENSKLCHVLPYIIPKTIEEVGTFWKDMVETQGYEGLVARSDHETYKIKPHSDVDAVIIAINKRDLFYSKNVTSIRVALMNDQGKFVEIGDCASGIDHKLRVALWKLVEEFKVSEDDKMVWVKPFVICKIEYENLFKGKNAVFSYDEKQGYIQAGSMSFVRMKSPRLIDLRSDKRVTPEDLRLEQIPLDFWKDVWAISDSLGRADK